MSTSHFSETDGFWLYNEKGGFSSTILNPTINLTPETGKEDYYCGVDLPADLVGISVTKKFKESGQPYPTNSWLSQVLRPPATKAQGAFYTLPLALNPYTTADKVAGLNITAGTPNLMAKLVGQKMAGAVDQYIFYAAHPEQIDPPTSQKIHKDLTTQGYLEKGGKLDQSKNLSELQLSGDLSSHTDQTKSVLKNYQTGHEMVSQLYKPAMESFFQAETAPGTARDFVLFPKPKSGDKPTTDFQFNRYLIDEFYDWSAKLELPLNWNEAKFHSGTPTGWETISVTVTKGGPLLFFDFVKLKEELTLLVADDPSRVPELTYSSHDAHAPSADFEPVFFPEYHYFGIILNGRFWGLFLPAGGKFTFSGEVKAIYPAALSASFYISTDTSAGPASKHLTIALLPYSTDVKKRQQILDHFASEYAYNAITSTSVSYSIDEKDLSVTTTFEAKVKKCPHG